MGYLLICLIVTVFVTAKSSEVEKLRLSNCRQSSTRVIQPGNHNLSCDTAIDGNFSQHVQKWSCSQVKDLHGGWWSARTDQVSHISTIRIYNRIDYLTGGLKDISITVDGVECANYRSDEEFSVKSFNCNAIGEVVKIYSRKSYLSLCEVEVFGKFYDTAEMLKLTDCKQSSTFYNGNGNSACKFAIDGNKNDLYSPCSACLSKNKEAIGWWSAKLEKRSKLEYIRIYNRVHCCTEGLTDFTIMVDGVQCASYKSNRSFAIKTLDCPVVGQSVYIDCQTPYLTLVEVEVFGRYIKDYDSTENQLRLTECQQTSMFLIFDCTRAIDGSTDGYLNTVKSCSHVNNEATGWWSAKVAKRSKIASIRIYNRIECCQERLTNFVISVDGVQCASYKSDRTFNMMTFVCDTIGQEIKISSRLPYLTLCEVKAFGHVYTETSNGRPHFTRRMVQQCLKPKFLKQPAVPVNNEAACANACLELGTACQGFQLMGDNKRCQILKFDKCSHNPTIGNCGNYVWVHVRNQPGLPDGKLCPQGYGHAHNGSTYKLISVYDWSEGDSRCGAEKGLSKYADASDKQETQYMHWLKINAFYRTSFFIGGYKHNGAFKWKDCNRPLLSEVWGAGHPSSDRPSTLINININAGVDSTLSYRSSLKHALCECIDPFA